MQKPKLFFFWNSARIEDFTADTQSCLMASTSMRSIECAGLVSDLFGSLGVVNSIASAVSKKVVARLPGFVIPRVLKERTDLYPGRHWHWQGDFSTSLFTKFARRI